MENRDGSPTFAEKMSNPAFMSVVFEGDKREVRSLYGKMKRLQERKESLVENCFYQKKRWLGNLVTRLGEDYREVYCRGTWEFLTMRGNKVSFLTETAWQPPFALLRMIQRHYPSLQFFFKAEGDNWDAYVTNDDAGRYFSSRYIVDCEPDIEYFDTIEEACSHLSAYTGMEITPTWEALEEAANDWNNCHEESDWPVGVKRIEVISNDELWE